VRAHGGLRAPAATLALLTSTNPRDGGGERACHRLRVRRRACAAAVDVGRYVVDLLAVLVSHRVPVGGPRVSPENHPVLSRAEQGISARGACWATAERALNTMPAMVVPVLVAVGAFRPSPASIAFRLTRSAAEQALSGGGSRPAGTRRRTQAEPAALALVHLSDSTHLPPDSVQQAGEGLLTARGCRAIWRFARLRRARAAGRARRLFPPPNNIGRRKYEGVSGRSRRPRRSNASSEAHDSIDC
jgi:hypothetical protein